MKHIRTLLAAALLIGSFNSCMKPDVGFLSDNIFYRSNPFVAKTGLVYASAPLETDGSTAPLAVKLLAIRNKATGQPADDLLEEREITTFLAEILETDNTIEKLNAKMQKSMVKPFNVNPVGGRLEFSPATAYVTPGVYTIDLEISNVRGSRIMKDACEIRIEAPQLTDLYMLNPPFWSLSDIGSEAVFYSIAEPMTMTVEHDPTGPNKIIFKWKDKNGTFFNPKAGDVVLRGDRPHFATMNPYFAEEKTDTALVFQYPTVPAFPVQRGTYGNFLNYYRIPGGKIDLGKNLNNAFEMRFFAPGTWNVTINVTVAAKL